MEKRLWFFLIKMIKKLLPLVFVLLLAFSLRFYQLGENPPHPPRTKWLLAAWLLLAPLPASLATDAPHAMRSFNVLPVPQILAALGVIILWQRISENWKKQAEIGLVIFLIFHLAYLYHQYFVNFPFEQSDSF